MYKKVTLFSEEQNRHTLEHLPTDDMSSLSPKQQAQHKQLTAVSGFSHIHFEPFPNPFRCEKTLVIFLYLH